MGSGLKLLIMLQALRNRSLRFFFIAMGAASLLSELALAEDQGWPFDQRQILLARPEGQQFPDDLTAAQIMDVFVKKGRIRWVTRPGAVGQLIPIEIPSDFPWRSPNSVKSLGAKYKVDGVLTLWAKGQEITLNWYSTADGQPLFFESLHLPSPGQTVDQAEKRKLRLTEWLLDVWSRIPGQGYVVKRNLDSIEIEGADTEGIKPGDKVEFVRLEKAERHPVLKTLTGISSSVVGTGDVLLVSTPFSKVKLSYESDLDPVREGDRYRLIITNAAGSSVAGLGASSGAGPVAEVKSEASESKSGLGDALGIESKFLNLAVSGGYGKLSHTELTETPNEYALSSNGYLLKIRADILISRDWFAGLDYAIGFHSYGSLPTDYAESSLSSGLQSMKVFGGYRWIMDEGNAAESWSGTELHFMGGYSRLLAKMGSSTSTVAPSQKTYSGLYLGAALLFPVINSISVLAEVDRAFGTSLTESIETSGANSKNTLWNFDFVLNYDFGKSRALSLGLHNMKSSSTFSGSGSRAVSSASVDISGLYGSLGYRQQF